MTKPDAVQTLIDKQAITELLYRYCRSVDRLDPELGRSIWNPNSEADYGDFYQGAGPDVIDLICRQHQHLDSHTHQMSNILIEVTGERAASESYITATLRLQKADALQQITVWSRYVDQWSRHDGRWGLDKRIAIRDFDEIRPITVMNRSEMGRRDKQDPSYTVLSV